MSALAAVFDASGRDHRDDVTRMLDAASHRAPGPSRVWRDGPVTLGLRRRGRGGPDPLVDARTGRAIVSDGRIDNVDDLAAALRVEPALDTDSLLLAAYDRWGEAMAPRLVGDFAFIIWDPVDRRLFCARDVFGQRPMFHAAAKGIVALASEPQQLLAHPSIPSAINEGSVAEYLTGTPATVHETVWQHVARLPHAHALHVSAAGVRVAQYWDFSPEARIEYASDGEYVAAFMEVMRVAVRACVRDSPRAVGVFLSGGLDSSAVAALAARTEREEGGPAVRAYSTADRESEWDETPYIDAVVERWNLPSIRLDGSAVPRACVDAEIARYRDIPSYPNGSSLDALRRRAAEDVEVVLTGYGGDEWFTGTPFRTTDLIRGGHLATAARQWWADGTRRGGGCRKRAALLRYVAAPLVPASLKPYARALVGPRPTTIDWIRPELAARTNLADRVRPCRRAPMRTLVQSEMHALWSSAPEVIGDEQEDRAAARCGIEQRHPFSDRRVAEFGFALPEAQRTSGPFIKAIIRRALGDDLPRLVRERRTKAQFSESYVDAIEQIGGRSLFTALAVAEAGWVDPAAALAYYDRLATLYRAGDAAYSGLVGPVWAIAAVELWYRHITGASS